MYTYYVLVELNVIDRKHGGKFITPIQLIQFIICLLSAIYETLNPNDCGTDMSLAFWLWLNYIIFFVFFVKIFLEKSSEREAARKTDFAKKDL